MDKELLDRLEAREGSVSAAARAVLVSPQRWRVWRLGNLTEDGQLRCWMALRKDGALLLAQFAAAKQLEKARGLRAQLEDAA